MKSHTALNSTPLTRSFRPIDQVMDFAAKHKQSVVGHTQIFNRDGNYPAWLFKHVDRVTFWGFTDRRSWLNTWPWKRTNHGLLFDREDRPLFRGHASF